MPRKARRVLILRSRPQVRRAVEEGHGGRPDRPVGFEHDEDGLARLEGPVSEPDDGPRGRGRRLTRPTDEDGRPEGRGEDDPGTPGPVRLQATAPLAFFLRTRPGSRPV